MDALSPLAARGEGPGHHDQRRAGPPRAREPAQGLLGGHGGGPAGDGDRAAAHPGARAGRARRARTPRRTSPSLLQPDPDPDGIASALALRQVLRRNRATAPIVTFGGVARPENVAMLELLEIDLEVIRPEDLARFERVALLDVQPNVLPGACPTVRTWSSTTTPSRRATARASATSASSYGATSTILTEYCLAAEVADPAAPGHRAPVRDQERHAVPGPRDLEGRHPAFSYLYPLVNTNLLRRIEKPELPAERVRGLRARPARDRPHATGSPTSTSARWSART